MTVKVKLILDLRKLICVDLTQSLNLLNIGSVSKDGRTN
jgi:hypothetical protein